MMRNFRFGIPTPQSLSGMQTSVFDAEWHTAVAKALKERDEKNK